MRLTLRTLLAYLDDILPPSQAREIGAKVTDTPDASKLMQRIREVLKRRRVGAPALSGPGSGPDPNVVAEYLDNTLSPQTVIELEKICLASDMHLAEVAGCHSILTLVLSEPVEVHEDMRLRIHALGQSSKPAPVRPPERPPSDEPLAYSEDIIAQAPMAASAGTHIQGLSGTMDVSEMTEGIPDYLRQRSSWKKYAITAAVLAGVALWGASIYWELLGSGHQVASVSTPHSNVVEAPPEAVETVTGSDSASVAASTPQKPSADSRTEPQAAPVATTKPAGQTPATTATIEKPEPQVAVTKPAETPGPEVKPAMPDKPGNAEVAIAPGETPKATPAEDPAPPAVVQPDLTVLYTSGEGVGLISSPMQPDWMVFPRRGIVHTGDTLAIPAPYDAAFTLSEGTGTDLGLEIRLASETRLTRVPPKGLSRLGIEVHRGSVRISRAATSERPFKIMVRVAGRDWQIELAQPGTTCGIQVIPPRPIGPPGREGPMDFKGGMLVVSGAINIGLMGDKELVANTEESFRAGQGWIPWPVPGAPLQAESASGIPDWLTPEGVVLTPSARQIARTFEKEFALDRTVAVQIPPVIDDRQAKVSELAVKTCGLIGLYPDMVRGLRSDHEESRLAAIEYLREWLPTSPENPQLLIGSLEKFYRADDLQAITRLLWGYNLADARDSEVSRQLVTWLGDDDVSIRELAFYHVFRLTGKRYDYRPNLLPSHRLAAVLRWEDHLLRNGGLLVGN